MRIQSLFEKKLFGFKSREDKRAYNKEYKRLAKNVSEELAPHIHTRQTSNDEIASEEAKYQIIAIRARYKNAIVELNQKY